MCVVGWDVVDADCFGMCALMIDVNGVNNAECIAIVNL